MPKPTVFVRIAPDGTLLSIQYPPGVTVSVLQLPGEDGTAAKLFSLSEAGGVRRFNKDPEHITQDYSREQ